MTYSNFLSFEVEPRLTLPWLVGGGCSGFSTSKPLVTSCKRDGGKKKSFPFLWNYYTTLETPVLKHPGNYLSWPGLIITVADFGCFYYSYPEIAAFGNRTSIFFLSMDFMHVMTLLVHSFAHSILYTYGECTPHFLFPFILLFLHMFPCRVDLLRPQLLRISMYLLL